MGSPSLYAKSARGGQSPVGLVEHLVATAAAVRKLRRRVGTIVATSGMDDRLGVAAGGVFGRDGGVFWQVVEAAAVAHDLGKVADGFQDMLAGRTRGWGHRHELLSLGFLPAVVGDVRLRDWVASAVITHHRPLSAPPYSSGTSMAALYAGWSVADLRDELGPIDDAAVGYLCRWLRDTLADLDLDVAVAGDAGGGGGGGPVPAQTGAALVAAAHEEFARIQQRWEVPVDRATGLAAVLLQGALTLADHLSSAGGVLHERQPIGAGFPDLIAERFGGPGRIHAHQRECAGVGGHLLLRSPTGSGKTEAGLLWAAGQVTAIAAATGGTPRVFLTLPYLASINAMAARLGRLLGDRDLVGVAHSRAASYHLSNAAGSDDDADARRAAARKAVSQAAATRLFRQTVRVATPYQLLRAALAGPAHASILIDCASSVIVLDELHAYDATRLGYILASARLWEQLGCRVAVLSATLPTALAEQVGEALQRPVAMVVGPPGPPRHRIRLRQHQLTDPASIAEITASLRAGRSVLVVANNVAHAQALYAALAPVAREQSGEEDAAVLLHSRFRRGDRAGIEARLAARYASSVVPRQPGLVVATQVVEVSLDIDLDVLYTAAAPLEALLQRFGRVNRAGARPPADVVVCPPGYGPRRGGGPEEYADGVYQAGPVAAGLAILARHDGQPVDEAAATGWLDEIYASEWGQRWREEIARARRVFDRDFLTFHYPFAARDELDARFDELFDGTEAILIQDRDEYEAQLATEPGARPSAAGRLLGEEYLIPLPHWATALASYDKQLRVAVIDGDYDDEQGLLAVRPIRGTAVYQPGEVI